MITKSTKMNVSESVDIFSIFLKINRAKIRGEKIFFENTFFFGKKKGFHSATSVDL